MAKKSNKSTKVAKRSRKQTWSTYVHRSLKQINKSMTMSSMPVSGTSTVSFQLAAVNTTVAESATTSVESLRNVSVTGVSG